ncbi:MAG: bifunctional oligoribonuclease/PAP phosphatase NrnA [Geothrix sp.]|uniref:DHH family phosphoesterase n=1 Tax=Geothrix sp. TaxID=1962974 RepID=UPI00184494D8|nr:bifunctional oligoribonuclease/PAP phosphatase NrnA [Geothrix sp.]NWJ40306.1 bifunctional oligoribonuclease/PAP phosphatase NrnA [Geothrix sp.]WIL21689.1 MAG: bifunctional oligoribonuclease/PAP phosphatase NrnA [Geothrix sp.]
MLDRFTAFLDRHGRVLLTTHENPDGDGVGAAVALACHLKAAGKETRIVVTPSLPENLRFLDPEGWIETYDPDGSHRNLAAWPDAWLLIDASEPHRMGALFATFESTKADRACLDHHLKDAPKGFDAEFTDSSASASTELVYDLVRLRNGGDLPPLMAQALYAGLVSDTGNFRHSNSTPKVHHAAADLIAQGVHPARTFNALYQTATPAKLRLFGRAMGGLQLRDGGRFAYVAVTKQDLDACGATHEDLDELVEEPRKLKGVEVAALFSEAADGRAKVSLRSRERVDVNAVCRKFGGGGHRLASGAKLDLPLDALIAQVEAAVISQIGRDIV